MPQALTQSQALHWNSSSQSIQFLPQIKVTMQPPSFSDPDIHSFCMKSLNLSTLLPQYYSSTHPLSQKSFFLERDISNSKPFLLQDAHQDLQLSYVKTSTITFQGLFHSKIIFANLPYYPALTFLSLSLCSLCIFLFSCCSDFTHGLSLAANTLYPCVTKLAW